MCISQVNFLSKLVALRPGKTVRDMIKDVMQGKDEGADTSESNDDATGEKISGGIAGKVSCQFQISKKLSLAVISWAL